MWYIDKFSRIFPAVVAVLAVSVAGSSRAAVLDVCATCTHTTLDSAFLAAGPDDTIILDGPDGDITAAPEVYILTANLVVNDTKDGLEIRGDSNARPDQIQVVGLGAGPVITVEANQTFLARGFTIMGGTTGILAMAGSTVEIRRCLIDGVGGIGVDCVNPEEVYMAGSVVTNCTGDAVRIDMGGELNITQCTFLTNTGLGVNAVAGMANVVATMIHDSGLGMADGTGTALEVAGNFVTDAAGAIIVNPGGAVDPYAFVTPLDTATAFETVDNFPGEFDDLYTDFPFSGETSATLSAAVSVEFFARDFSNVSRNAGNVVIGADERGVAAIAAAWIECFVVQRGQATNWVGEGSATILIYTENISLAGAQVWIGNDTQTVPNLGIEDTPANRIGPLPLTVPSAVDANFGTVNFTFDLDDMEIAFPNIPDVNTTDYEIYVQPSTAVSPTTGVLDPAVLDDAEAAGNQAAVGRIFGFDGIPPRVVDSSPLADRYLNPATDLGAIGAGPPGWGIGILDNVGANRGFLQGITGDPQVFFNNPAGGPLNFTIRIEFEDPESGFADSTASAPSAVPAVKDAILFEDYAGVPGLAWWSRSSRSGELVNGPANLAARYIGGGSTLEAEWEFTGNVFDIVNLRQWYATASIRVSDLAGNEAVLRPYHLWWFPDVLAQFRSGPGDDETANPVFTWGLERLAGGQDPRDPDPCYPSVQWRLWRAVFSGVPGTAWTDITDLTGTNGFWSDWMHPNFRTITLDTFFQPGVTLRQLILNGGAPGDQYLIAVRGYDEAGNLQTTTIGAGNQPLNNLGDLGNLIYQRWTDPGVSASLGLDTKVQPTFWHNSDGDRVIDVGERSFGAARRIPLPAAVPCPSPRVEAGFNITMDLSDSIPPANAFVAFQLFEDGRFAASGVLSPVNAPAGQPTLVIPYDLLNPNPSFIVLDNGAADTAFLNNSTCEPGVSDRLGDDGVATQEPAPRQRDVKYQLLLATGFNPGTGDVFDPTPATVEFTVTVDRGLKDDQPIKSFVQE